MLSRVALLAFAVGLLLAVLLSASFAEDKKPPLGPDKETQGLEDALRRLHAPLAGGDPLSPQDSYKKLKVADGLALDLVGHEPLIRQPLAVTFDERGRMWVMQYIQYPFPSGLKIVAYDQYIRAKFDKVPPPPPKHFKGDDKITIHSFKKDGSIDKSGTFVDGLSIATSVLHGRDGVWVMNPPYLLFYPDKNRDDKPDADPVVHLSGFGLEDTHAVASNLAWGPDGWIYGTQGSTCTAKVKVEVSQKPETTDFLGQAIWRYHPEQHIFEIFAEGGGNTFGLEFDDQGRIYSGTNWGTYRGLHYVQGGYYVKGWGKHGPLTNPYALGFFQHMPHTGNADRLTHTFVVYGGGTLPKQYNDKLLGPSPLQKRIQVTRREAVGSSYKTIEEPFMMTSEDGWFRPVDTKVGPDGALYICDFYENRISHVDPRDNWHRDSGRIYRIRSRNATESEPFDLAKLTSKELVALLSHPNRWHRQTALRLLGDRQDRTISPLLKGLVKSEEGQLALEALWAVFQTEEDLDDKFALECLDHKNAAVRAWTVRLLGDDHEVSKEVGQKLTALVAKEPDSQVRSQLASTAKRLRGTIGVQLAGALLSRDEDSNDPHIPLLIWWAIEAHAETDRQAVVDLLREPALWKRPLTEKFLVERIMQRYAMASGPDNLKACARLLELAPTSAHADLLLGGMEKAFAGKTGVELPDELKKAMNKVWAAGAKTGQVSLGLRLGDTKAVDAALKLVADTKTPVQSRIDTVRILGEVSQPRCVPVLLDLVKTGPKLLQQEALASLQRYDEGRIGKDVLALYLDGKTFDNQLRESAQSLLSSRASWSLELLGAVEKGNVKPQAVSMDVVRKLLLFKDPQITKLVEKHWGKVRPGTAEEKKRELLRVAGFLKQGKGEAGAGKVVFGNTCGKCHKLFNEGAVIGPELTGYERDNLLYWLENIIDPSAAIRDEYMTFIVETKDGRTLTGLIAEQDKQSVTLKAADGQVVKLARDRIESLQASQTSIMPEDQLKGLSETQIRDLFAYLTSKK